MPNRLFLLNRCVLTACLCLFLSGCGGGDETSSDSSDTDTSTTTPSAPTVGATTPSSGATTPSTPDGTVKAFFNAVKNNQLGDIWDLLPPSYQQDINGLVRDFAGQVDAELWDQSFALLTRYAKAQIDKQDMFLETPQSRQSFAMLGSMGLGDMSWLTKEKIKALSEPSNNMTMAFLNGEFSSVAKLKAFDGKAFLNGTLNSVLKNIRIILELVQKEIQQNPQLQSNMDAQLIASKLNLNQLLDQISVTAGPVNGDNATVKLQMSGQVGNSPPLQMTRVEGKWIPTGMAGGFKQGIQLAKLMVPSGVQAINGAKQQVMPVLQTVEPLIAALEQASTQDEFNIAYTNLEQATQAQMAALGGGVPGFDPAMLGGGANLGFGGGAGSQSLSAVTVVVNQELNEKQLKKLVHELEQLTDNPEEAILMPKSVLGETTIQVTPVKNFLGFTTTIPVKKSGMSWRKILQRKP